jgi:hypothetical protein
VLPVLNYLSDYQLPSRRLSLEKLAVAEIVKKFSAFHGP